MGSRDSANDKSTLTPLSASSIDLAHSAPRVKDNAWATAFKVNIGLTFLVALYFGGPVLKLIKLATLGRSGQLNLEYEESKNYYRWFRLKVLFILVVALRVMVAIVMARSWTLLRMIIRCPKFIIKVCSPWTDCTRECHEAHSLPVVSLLLFPLRCEKQIREDRIVCQIICHVMCLVWSH